MDERTIMIFAKGNCFVGKFDKNTNIVSGLVMCSFTTAMSQNGPLQFLGMRKLGSMNLNANDVDNVIDLENDSDVYRDYVKLTTGVQVQPAGSMPKPSTIKH